MIHRINAKLLAIALLAASTFPVLAADTLTDKARLALTAALEDEYKAEAFYAAVMEKFGAVRPFVNIIQAEQTHSSAIGAVMRTHGLDAGKNPLLKDSKITASVPATIEDACRMGVKAEIENRDLYDKKLLPDVAEYSDIRVVFQRLRDASQDNHLPAFERCAAGGGPNRGR